MRYIVDRFEGKYAIVELEDGTMIDIPRLALPVEAKEGDSISIEILIEETIKRRTVIQNKLDDLFGK